MLKQTTAVTIQTDNDIRSIDIGHSYFVVTDKENNSVRINGLSDELWLNDIRYFVSSFEYRTQDADIIHGLERLQDTLTDTLKKIRPQVNTEASA